MNHFICRSAARLAAALVLAVCLSGPAHTAMSADKIYRIAILSYIPGAPEMQLIKQGLQRYGYIEGVNTAYLLRNGVRNGDDHSGAKDLLDQDVSYIVQWQPDLIISMNTNAGVALMKNPAAARIPVFFWGADGVESGFAVSFRHPGGNMTGYSSRPALATLYLRLLKLSIPNFKRIGHLFNGTYAIAPSYERDLQEAGRLFGVEVKRYDVNSIEEIDSAFARMKSDGMQAVKVGPHEMFDVNGPEIGRLALKHGLAAVGQESLMLGGGFASIVGGRDWDSVLPTMDKILQGAKPAEIPIQRNWPPLVTLNLESARQLGISVPESLIDEADVVIQPHTQLNRESANALGLKIPEGVKNAGEASAPMLTGTGSVAERQLFKPYRIAVLSYGSLASFAEVKRGLELMGLKEGVNVEYLKRAGGRDGDPHSGAKERLAGAVQEIVAWKPDLILQMNTNAGVAIKASADAAKIPVVGWSAYAVGAGFAKSYRHPGMNFTGFSSAPETSIYYMRALKLIIPGLKRIGHLYNPGYAIADEELAKFKSAAALMGVTVKTYTTPTRADFEKSIAQMKKDGMQAIHVGPHETFHVFGEEIGALAMKYGLPAAGRDAIVKGGGILSIDGGWSWAPVLPNIIKVLNGAYPGDIPIERNFAPRMTLNLRAIRQLGLTVPNELIQEADELIEE